MKQLIFRLIYAPPVNALLRRINKLLYPILPKQIKIPPSGTISIRIGQGKKVLMRTNQTNYLTQLIFWEGFNSFEYTAIFRKLVKKMDCFLDVGANIGYYSLLAAVENPAIKVVAFEPAEGPLFYLRENVRINGLHNISVEGVALSHKGGTIDFHEVRSRKYTYLKYNLAGTGSSEGVTLGEAFTVNNVPTSTLENFLSGFDRRIDLVKIDTEGSEHLILKASGDLLAVDQPIVICETLFNTIESDLEEIFEKFGYEYYNHTANGLVKVSTIRRETDNGVRNCFFVHPSKYHLIKDFVI